MDTNDARERIAVIKSRIRIDAAQLIAETLVSDVLEREGILNSVRAELVSDWRTLIEAVLEEERAHMREELMFSSYEEPDVARICRKTLVQNCHLCNDVDCGDNSSPLKTKLNKVENNLRVVLRYVIEESDKFGAAYTEKDFDVLAENASVRLFGLDAIDKIKVTHSDENDSVDAE